MIATKLLKKPGVLEKVGEELNIPCITGTLPLDPITAAALIQDANLTSTSVRDINKYMKQTTGIRLFPPHSKLKKLTEHFVAPIHGVADIGEEKITYWYRRIDECITNMLDNELQEFVGKFDNIDVVFGGDHGQRVFSAGIKIILW